VAVAVPLRNDKTLPVHRRGEPRAARPREPEERSQPVIASFIACICIFLSTWRLRCGRGPVEAGGAFSKQVTVDGEVGADGEFLNSVDDLQLCR